MSFLRGRAYAVVEVVVSNVHHKDQNCPVIGCSSCAIRKMNDNWVPGSCVECGEARLFWKDSVGKRCTTCEIKGVIGGDEALVEAFNAQRDKIVELQTELKAERLKVQKLREALLNCKMQLAELEYAREFILRNSGTSLEDWIKNEEEQKRIDLLLAETEDKT